MDHWLERKKYFIYEYTKELRMAKEGTKQTKNVRKILQ